MRHQPGKFVFDRVEVAQVVGNQVELPGRGRESRSVTQRVAEAQAQALATSEMDGGSFGREMSAQLSDSAGGTRGDGSEDRLVGPRSVQRIEIATQQPLVAHEFGVDQHFDADVSAGSRRPTRNSTFPKLLQGRTIQLNERGCLMKQRIDLDVKTRACANVWIFEASYSLPDHGEEIREHRAQNEACGVTVCATLKTEDRECRVTEVVHAKEVIWLRTRLDAMEGTMEGQGQLRLVEATIREVTRLSPRVVGLVVEAPTDFEWLAGQHLPVSGQPRGGELGYYSIASAPRSLGPGCFELAVAEDSWPLAGEIEPGTALFVGPPSGALPLGRLMDARRVVLVGMGTGVAPLRATVQSLLAEDEKGRRGRPHVTLIQGARSLEECFFREEFEALRGRRFTYRPVLSQELGAYTGLRGRVQQHLDELPTTEVEYCLCGSKAMVEDVSARLLALGVSSECIFAEGY